MNPPSIQWCIEEILDAWERMSIDEAIEDNRRMDYMRSLFGVSCPDEDEVEVRCLLTFALFVGSPFMAADHGQRSRREMLELALRRLED